MMFKPVTIIFVSSFPFLFSLSGDFVFDDSEAITKNKDVTTNRWLHAFYNDFWGTDITSNFSHKSYRPLTILSFRLNYILNGNSLSPVQFKVTNLLCHVSCCLLVWQTYKILLNSLKPKHNEENCNIAFLAALLFSVHPVHTEAVSGIVGRADILAAVTFFLAILLYIKIKHSPKLNCIYICTTIILAGVSMLFKENGITVLGLAFVYELITNINFSKESQILAVLYIKKQVNKKMFFIRILLLLLAIIVLLYMRWVVMGGAKPEFKPTDNPAAFSNSLFTKVATYNYIYVTNILLLLWPQWLCYDWSMGCIPLIKDFSDHRMIPVLLLYLYGILFIKAVLHRRNNNSTKRVMILAAALMIIPYLPASNILFPVGFVVAERILYIPSAGYCLLVAIGYYKIKQNGLLKRYKVIHLAFPLLLMIYGLRTWQRSSDWQNEYQLYTKGLLVCPMNAKVHYNVAKVADAKQQTDWALKEYKEAIRLYPEYYQAMNNLANLLKHQKKFSEAEIYLRTAIKYKRDFPAAWMNLGIVLANKKIYDEAEIAYKTALEYRKNYPDCHYNLGNLYLEMNLSENAVESWYRAINLNPVHTLAWTNLIALLDNTGQTETAMQVIPKALKNVPDSPSINFAVANIYGKLNRYKDAEKRFLEAIKLFDNKIQAIHYANLGVLYHRWKKYKAAEHMYKNALRIDPNFKSAQRNLQQLQKLTS